MGSVVPGWSSGRHPKLLVFSARVRGYDRAMALLVDSGASQNFASLAALKESPQTWRELTQSGRREGSVVRLADGTLKKTEGVRVRLAFSFEDFECSESFAVLQMQSQYDLILGMPWLQKHQPWIDWRSLTIGSSTQGHGMDGHLREAYAIDDAVNHVGEEDVSRRGVPQSKNPATAPVGELATRRMRSSKSLSQFSESEGISSPTRCDVMRGTQSYPSMGIEKNGELTGEVTALSLVQKGKYTGEVTVPPVGTAREDSDAGARREDRPSMPPTLLSSNREGMLSTLDAGDLSGTLQSAGACDATAAHTRQNKKGQVKRTVAKKCVSFGEVSVQMLNTREPPLSVVRHVDTVQPTQEGEVQRGNGQESVLSAVTSHQFPTSAEELVKLSEMDWDIFLAELKAGQIDELAVPTAFTRVEACHSSSTMDMTVLETDKKKRFAAQGWDALRDSPFFDVLWKHRRVFPDEVPCALPVDRGIRHEVDLEPGTKYCVTRQWPLPREQVEYIDEFFAKRAKAGQVRESKSPHCSPTFCVKKATGGWRVVHAYNKLNAATIPAQTPIPRKDVLIDSMSRSTLFSSLDLMDGYYQVLMAEPDIPKTAVSTPSGMLWEWLVMPQGLKNAPATFNRLVSHLLRPHRSYAPSYFDDIFVHSRARDGLSEVEMHRIHLDAVLQTIGDSRLYCNLKKCVFGASEIPVLGCFVGRNGVRADPEKIRAIQEWPVPRSVKDLRQFLGLANYLHKFSKNYALTVKPLTDLLKKEVEWAWDAAHREAFTQVKRSLVEAPVLALPDADKAFSVVCDASQFAIGSALMQKDDDGVDRVISYQSRLLKAAELNYPVHDKELLAIKYALVKFRVHLLGPREFVVFTDHASLRTAINTPHLSQRMARWLSFFSEYNFRVEYKPGKMNVLADALSRRPDFEETHARNAVVSPDAVESHALNAMRISRLESSLADDIKERYSQDEQCRLLISYLDKGEDKLTPQLRAKLSRFSYSDGLLWHQLSPCDELRIYVPHDTDLKLRILHECHDVPHSGHMGREKTFNQVSNEFWWPHLYRWVANYIRSCEQCQRVKSSPSGSAPLNPLPIPSDCWKSMSLDFFFGLPPDPQHNTGVAVFVDRLSKMVHMAPCRPQITGKETAVLFLDHVFKLHGLPESIISDRDPRFTAAFWQHVFARLGTQVTMSTADHPQTDGQTERVNRVVEDILRCIALERPRDWSSMLPFVEFAINNSVHTTTGETPFYVNGLRHPRTPVSFVRGSNLSGGGHLAAPLDANAVGSNACDAVIAVAADADAVPLDANAVRSNACDAVIARDADADAVNSDLAAVTRSQSRDAAVPTGAIDAMMHDAHTPQVADNSALGEMATNTVPIIGRPASETESSASSSRQRPPATGQEDTVQRRRAKQDAEHFLDVRIAVIRKVRDLMANAQERQKEYADRRGRRNFEKFKVGDEVLLSTHTLPKEAITCLPGGATKLLPRYVGPFKVVRMISDVTYQLDLPTAMRTHPVFYVGRLKRYHSPTMAVYPAARLSSPRASHGGDRTLGDRGDEPDSQEPQHERDPPEERDSHAPESQCDLGAQQQRSRASRSFHRAPPVALVDSHGAQRFHVQELRAHRRHQGTYEYLVRWRGYPPDQDSWEPHAQLFDDVPDLVAAYRRAHGLESQ